MRFDSYQTEGFYDELFDSEGRPREGADLLVERIQSLPPGELKRRHQAAERALMRLGITFNVYGQAEADERLIPFDIVPRIISGREWTRLTKGIEQRVRAINAFLYDIYHRQEIIRAIGSNPNPGVGNCPVNPADLAAWILADGLDVSELERARLELARLETELEFLHDGAAERMMFYRLGAE